MKDSRPVVVGLDPGSNGGWVGVYEDFTIAFKTKLPMCRKNSQTTGKPLVGLFVDEVGYMKLIRETISKHNVIAVYMEDPSEPQRKGGLMKMGRTIGEQRGIMIGMGINPRMVHPKTWQNKIFTKDDIIMRGGNNKQKETKLTAVNAARRICPNCDLSNKKVGTIHDGIVDSFLIGVYGWIKQNKDD